MGLTEKTISPNPRMKQKWIPSIPAHPKTDAQQKELAKEMKELQKEFGDDKTKAPQSGSMRDRVNQILNEDK